MMDHKAEAQITLCSRYLLVDDGGIAERPQSWGYFPPQIS